MHGKSDENYIPKCLQEIILKVVAKLKHQWCHVT